MRIVLGAVLLCVLCGCGRGPGPWVAAVEAAYPEVSDIAELETATRVRVTRSDSYNTWVNGQPVSASHAQSFEAREGYTLDDVLTELERRIGSHGWTFLPQPDNYPLCAVANEAVAEGVPATLTVNAVPEPLTDRWKPYVTLRFGGSCRER